MSKHDKLLQELGQLQVDIAQVDEARRKKLLAFDRHRDEMVRALDAESARLWSMRRKVMERLGVEVDDGAKGCPTNFCGLDKWIPGR